MATAALVAAAAAAGGIPPPVRHPAPMSPAAAPVAVSFVSARDGFVATAGGAVLATRDGGRSWSAVHRGLRFDAIDFVSGHVGFALSRSRFFRTGDGGRTWVLEHRFARGRPAGAGQAAISFVDDSNGWVAPLAQFFYRTKDGGRTWGPVRFGCDFYLAGISLVDLQRGYVACGGQPSAGMQQREYFTTADAGDHWLKFKDGVFEGYATAIQFVETGVGFLAADRGGIERVDGGRSVLFADDLDDVLAMSWTDVRHGFAALLHAGLLRTTDGGAHWRRVYPR